MLASTPANSPTKAPREQHNSQRHVQTQIQFTIPPQTVMTSRRHQRRRDAAHHTAMVDEEQDALTRKIARAARRARRKAVKKEDYALANAFSSVSVGASASSAPVLGAPVKKDAKMGRVHSRIRKPCKKCQERRRKIRERAETHGKMIISKPKPTLRSKDISTITTSAMKIEQR